MSASMHDYRVELESFSGPLDLLLFLVKRDEIDLLDIPIGRLAEQYLQYLARLQQIDVDLAGEFLVMAATLLEIKSAMILPAAPAETPQSDGDSGMQSLDPRMELVQQLLAYKRFKDLARRLEERMDEWAGRFPRLPFQARAVSPDGAALLERAMEGPTWAEEGGEAQAGQERLFDLDDANVLDLAEAFARVMETIGRGPAAHEVIYDDTPIGLHAEDILDRLGREGAMTLQAIFAGRTRSERVGLFLALLELVRQRKVRVSQDDLASQIGVELCPAQDQAPEPSQPADESRWIDPETGERQYDWPSEEARQAAQRRQRLRDKWARGKAAGPADPASGQPHEPPPDEPLNDHDLDEPTGA